MMSSVDVPVEVSGDDGRSDGNETVLLGKIKVLLVVCSNQKHTSYLFSHVRNDAETSNDYDDGVT
jgi:hypothetical protein